MKGRVFPMEWMELLKMCAVVCPLVFLAGFVDSAVGGGGLISLPAYLFVGLPVHIASGTNKVVNATGTALASWRYFKNGKVQVKPALIAAAGALLGSTIGTRIALYLDQDILQTVILIILPVVAVILAIKKDFGKEGSTPLRNWSKTAEMGISLAIGLFIGAYDGMIGPGTGTFMMMAFTLVLGMDLVTASGCAKVGNLASNVASAVVWILNGQVLYSLVLPAAAFNLLGSFFGSQYAIRGGAQKLRSLIFVVLGLLFLKFFTELF